MSSRFFGEAAVGLLQLVSGDQRQWPATQRREGMSPAKLSDTHLPPEEARLSS